MTSRKRAGAVSYGLFAGALVFVSFGAYARFAPTTYVATARVILDPVPPQPLVLPPAPFAATQLTNAALDAEGLALIGAELELPRESSAEVHEHIRKVLTISEAAKGSFDVTVSDLGAARAQRLCNLVASRAAAKAMFVLTPRAADLATKHEAEQRVRRAELEAFVAAHPELAEPTIAPIASSKRMSEAAEIDALRAERDRLVVRLSKSGSADSDNPFASGTSPELVQLERRVKEIDSRIGKLKGRDKKPLPKIEPAVEKEWRRLREAAAQPAPEAPSHASAPFTPRLVAAAMPSTPIKPDRRLVLILGVALSLLSGVVVGAWRKLALRRQPPSSRRGSNVALYGDPRHTSSNPPRAASSHPPGHGSNPPGHGSSPPGYGSNPPGHGSNPPGYGSNPPPQGGSNPPPFGEPVRLSSSNPPPFNAEVPRAGSSNPPAPGVNTVLANPIVSIAGPPPLLPNDDAPRTVPMNPRPSPAPMPAVEAERIEVQRDGHAPLAFAKTDIVVPNAERDPLPGSRTPSSSPPRAPYTGETEGDGKPPLAVPTFPGTRTPLSSAPPPPPDPAFVRRKKDEPFGVAPSARAPITPTIPPPPLGNASPAASESASDIVAPKPDTASSTPALASTLVATGVTPPAVTPGAGKKQTLAGPFTPELPPEGKEAAAAPKPSEGRKRPGRTTQMLGSPIAPTVRESTRPVRRSTPPEHPSAMPPAAPRTPTGYSYITEPAREAGAPQQSNLVRTPPAPRHVPTQLSAPRPASTAPEPQVSLPTIHKRRTHGNWSPDPSVNVEQRRELAAQLAPLAVDGCFVLGISVVPEAREHKTPVACEIALALAGMQHPRVLLVEGNFQWPVVHEVMRIEMPFSLGFSQQLRTNEPAAKRSYTVVECAPTLHVMAEGILRSPGLILSSHFEDSLRAFRSVYDFVIIDGPPVSEEVDCRALDSLIDGIVLVSPESGSPWLVQASTLFSEKRLSTVVSAGRAPAR